MVILDAYLSSADFFKNQLFVKILIGQGIPSECQTVWNQIRPDDLSGLIWVQTSFQSLSADDMTYVGKELPEVMTGRCFHLRGSQLVAF